MRTLTKPPLPFIGNKKNFKKEYMEAIKKHFKDSHVFIDLFGGSGFLSYLTKKALPNAQVIYNDFDNFSERVRNIPKTNEQIEHIKKLIGNIPRNGKISEDVKLEIIKYLNTQPYIDYITISSSILYTNNTAKSMDELQKSNFYNRTTKNPIPECSDYLKDLKIVSEDFRVLFNKYKGRDDVVFILDPPYFAAIKKQYEAKFWNWSDFTAIIDILKFTNKWVYFTNKESETCELLEYIDKYAVNNKINIHRCERYEKVNNCGAFAHFTDVMLIQSQG